MLKKLSLIALMPFLMVAQELDYHVAATQKMTYGDMVAQSVLGAAMGLLTGIGKDLGKPAAEVVNTVLFPFLHPIESLKSAQRLTFVSKNPNAFTFEELVQYQQAVNNAIGANLIDRANASNKALRQALIAGTKDKDEATQDNDCLFAINIVKAQLENFAHRLEIARLVYEQELMNTSHTGKATIGGAVAGTIAGVAYNYANSPLAKKQATDVEATVSTLNDNIKSRTFMGLVAGATVGYIGSKLMISPYSRQELQQVVFMVGQIQDHVLYMISMISELNDLSQITDKKDAITMVLKSLTSEIAQLAFAVDSSRAFDPKYKGLKLMYDASKLVDKSPKPVAD